MKKDSKQSFLGMPDRGSEFKRSEKASPEVT